MNKIYLFKWMKSYELVSRRRARDWMYQKSVMTHVRFTSSSKRFMCFRKIGAILADVCRLYWEILSLVKDPSSNHVMFGYMTTSTVGESVRCCEIRSNMLKVKVKA